VERWLGRADGFYMSGRLTPVLGDTYS